MQEIHGTAMHYPWGTTDAIPAILGIPADGRPFAEYWLGAHPLAPSRVDGRRLDELLADDPSLLGPVTGPAFGGRMPFLMKILSARHALSLQAHPARDKAEEGFAREEAAGIPLDDPMRIYKDPVAKHEILIALSEFRLLLGFRRPLRTYELFDGLGVADTLDQVIGPLVHRRGTAGTEEVFLDVLSLEGERLELLNRVLVAAVNHASDEGEVGDFARLIIELDAHFPGDPGILAACLMNDLTLQPGQAIRVPPGTMHADLYGTGIEVMANSDNVVRGGLTSKHIAVDELVGVVDFGEITPTVVEGVAHAPGAWSYPSGCDDFHVWRLACTPAEEIAVPGDGSLRLILVTRGTAVLDDGASQLPLEHGQAVLVRASDPALSVTGDAELFVSCPGVR